MKGKYGTQESWPLSSVAQVLADDGRVVGAGFLVGEGVVVTCAHVVEAAGGAPGAMVELRFPQVSGMPMTVGTVLVRSWRGPDAEDVAFVRVRNMPKSANPVTLRSAAGCRGHRVSSFGFPAQAPERGHFGYGTAGDLLPTGHAGIQLQLTQANDFTVGFSGGPVVDEVTGSVIGMITAITVPDGAGRGVGITYVTPAEVLLQAEPGLLKQSGSRKEKSGSAPDRGTGAESPAFQYSWAAGENLSGFSALPSALWGWPPVLVLVGGLFHDEIYPDGNAGVSAIVAAALLLLYYSSLLLARRNVRLSLRVRMLAFYRHAVVVSDPSGSQSIPWKVIQEVGIRYVKLDDVKLISFQVRLRGGYSVMYRPAGWPENRALPAVCMNEYRTEEDWLPVCLLGPLPTPLQMDLRKWVRAFVHLPLVVQHDIDQWR